MVLDVQVWFPWCKRRYLPTIMQPSICLSADIYKPIYLSIYLFIHPSILLFTYLHPPPLLPCILFQTSWDISAPISQLFWGPWWSNFRGCDVENHAQIFTSKGMCFFQPAFRSTTRSIHGIHLVKEFCMLLIQNHGVCLKLEKHDKKYWIKDDFLPGKHSLVINNKPGEIRVDLSFKTDLGRLTLESFGRCWCPLLGVVSPFFKTSRITAM